VYTLTAKRQKILAELIKFKGTQRKRKFNFAAGNKVKGKADSLKFR